MIKKHHTRKCEESPSYATSLLIELLKKLKDLATVLAQFTAPEPVHSTNLNEVKKTSAEALKVYRDYTENVRHHFDQHTVLRDKTNRLGVVLTSVIRCFIISINEPNNVEILDKIDLKQLVVRVKDINQYWQTEIAPKIREARRQRRLARTNTTKIRRSCSAGAMQRMYKPSGRVAMIEQSSPFSARNLVHPGSPKNLRPITPHAPRGAPPIPAGPPPAPPESKRPGEKPPTDSTHITRITSTRSQSQSSVSSSVSSSDGEQVDRPPTSRSSSYASTPLPPLPTRPSRKAPALPTLPIPASPEQLRNYVKDMRERIAKTSFTSEAQRRKAIMQLRQAIKKIIAINNEQEEAPQIPRLQPKPPERSRDDSTRSSRSKTHSPRNSQIHFHQRKKSNSFSSGQSEPSFKRPADHGFRSLHEPDKRAVAVPVEQLTADKIQDEPKRRSQIKSTAFSNFKDLLAQTELGLAQQSSPIMSPVISPREIPTPSIVMRDFSKIETFLDKEFDDKPTQRRSKRLTRTLSAGSTMTDKTWAPRRRYFGAIDDMEDSVMEESLTEEEVRQKALWMPIGVVTKPKEFSGDSLAGKSRITSSMRDKSVMELLGTEETYVEGLKVVVEFFLKPLNKELKNAREFGVEPLLSQEDVAKIFFLVEEILALHGPFVSKLRKAILKDSVGKPMLKLIPKLKKYADYAQNFNAAVKCLTKNLEESTRFRNYYDSIMKLPRVADMSLASLLVTPIQRIPRYKLLLESIIKHTATNHPDYYMTIKAKREVEKAMEYVEITKKEADNSDMLVQIRNKLVQSKKKGPFSLLKPNRTYLHQGVLDISCGKEKGTLHCFLFSDLLLTTKSKKSGFVVQNAYSLAGATMLEGSAKRGDRPLLQIFCDNKEILVTFSNIVRRDQWVPYFKQVDKTSMIEDKRQ